MERVHSEEGRPAEGRASCSLHAIDNELPHDALTERCVSVERPRYPYRTMRRRENSTQHSYRDRHRECKKHSGSCSNESDSHPHNTRGRRRRISSPIHEVVSVATCLDDEGEAPVKVGLSVKPAEGSSLQPSGTSRCVPEGTNGLSNAILGGERLCAPLRKAEFCARRDTSRSVAEGASPLSQKRALPATQSPPPLPPGTPRALDDMEYLRWLNNCASPGEFERRDTSSLSGVTAAVTPFVPDAVMPLPTTESNSKSPLEWQDVCRDKPFFAVTDEGLWHKARSSEGAETCDEESIRAFTEHFQTGRLHPKPPWFLCSVSDDNREHPYYLSWLDKLELLPLAEELALAKQNLVPQEEAEPHGTGLPVYPERDCTGRT